MCAHVGVTALDVCTAKRSSFRMHFFCLSDDHIVSQYRFRLCKICIGRHAARHLASLFGIASEESNARFVASLVYGWFAVAQRTQILACDNCACVKGA